jgi:cystathionine beta-lyase
MKRIIVDAAVVCVPGPWFGNGGQQHLRLNIGVPTDLLLEALNRIKTAIQ